MKKRQIVTIATISIALVLIGSVTYAAGKKRLAKVEVLTPDMVSEEEALAAELLAATGDQKAVPAPPVEKVAEERAEPKEGPRGG